MSNGRWQGAGKSETGSGKKQRTWGASYTRVQAGLSDTASRVMLQSLACAERLMPSGLRMVLTVASLFLTSTCECQRRQHG